MTGGPALSVCNGYTEAGLPLAMQIAGRPFDEETVLRVGDAYERATQWRGRRPLLVPGSKAIELKAPPPETITATDVDPAIRALVECAIARAELKLDDSQRASLYRVAPTVVAAVNRIRRDRPWADEPANAFFFPDGF